MTKKYGLHMLVTTDPAVKEHMANILKQVEGMKVIVAQDSTWSKEKSVQEEAWIDTNGPETTYRTFSKVQKAPRKSPRTQATNTA